MPAFIPPSGFSFFRQFMESFQLSLQLPLSLINKALLHSYSLSFKGYFIEASIDFQYVFITKYLL